MPASAPDAPIFHVRRPSALGQIVCSPGRLGLGRAYVEGSIETDDIDAAFMVIDGWEAPALSARQRARLGLALLLAALPGGLPGRPRIELILRGQRQHDRPRRRGGPLPL